MLKCNMAAFLLLLLAQSIVGQSGHGTIVYYSRSSSGNDICAIDPDGGSSRLIVADGQCPSLSPDGRRVAFQRDVGANKELYVIDIDGGNLRRLTDSPSTERQAAWSPDGRRIAFQSDRDGNPEIYTMDADGGGWQRVTYNDADDMRPSWSPDGQRFAFNSYRDGNWEIYVINTDGSNEQRLTVSDVWEVFPAWSPDGTKIAFKSGPPAIFEGDIHVMGCDGKNERAFVDKGGMEEDPVWSPDGSQIAFQAMRDNLFSIYVVDSSGGEWRRITDNTTHVYWPSWGPDAN